jgi:lipopolysaccharide/colanic/teichoic acid biosynthesis glycosyltransferase
LPCFGGALVKRAVDIVLSAFLLLICMPILVLAAAMIWFTSPGPVLFRQMRMGRGFRSFEILKLRTMAHAEAGLAYTLGPDPRITPLGHLLRRTKIDELPQLWNVLCGDMSLVGPRPVVPQLTLEFYEPYSLLLRIRPGLTDPASLKYSQETRLLERAGNDAYEFFKTVVTPDKIRISMAYMQRAGLWSDCVTMAMTAVVVCFPRVSRIYGELPQPGKVVAVRTTHQKAAETNVAPHAGRVNVGGGMDTAVFSHSLALVEAQAERENDGRKAAQSPWIPLPERRIGPRSTGTRARGSVSRL